MMPRELIIFEWEGLKSCSSHLPAELIKVLFSCSEFTSTPLAQRQDPSCWQAQLKGFFFPKQNLLGERFFFPSVVNCLGAEKRNWI